MILPALLIALTTAPPRAGAYPPAKPPAVVAQPAAWERRGLTLSIGLGNAYGLLGGQLRYDLPLRPWLHLAPFAAIGVIPEGGEAWMAGALGASGGLGRRHRLTGDVAVVPIVWDVLNVHGTTVDVRLIYGPQLALGYEHVSDGGWVQRLTIGYGWSLWGKGEGPFPSDLVFALGFGRRLW